MKLWHSTQLVLYIWTACQTLGILCAEHLVYSFNNQVGGGNFSYFKLHKDGYVRLVLTSAHGDADLYVSSSTLTPNYLDYELNAASCGEDSLEIPVDMARPVGIGVYGHPSYDVTDFSLIVYADDNGAKPESVQSGTPRSSSSSPGTSGGDEQEESILWSLFLGLLKIILDILV